MSILVPNSRFLEREVINWSHGSPVARLQVPVSVAYGSDLRTARAVLLRVARENGHVLTDPRPEVRLLEFGDHGLHLELLVWIGRPQRQFQIKSDLNFSIEQALREHGLSIPFPQVDMHVRSSRFDPLVDAWARQALPELGDLETRTTDAASERPLEDEHLLGQRPPTREQLEGLRDRMRSETGVSIKDRRHLFNTFERCFVGREAVAWMVANEGFTTAEAVRVGQMLIDADLAHHVLDEHGFHDSNLFYRFYSDE